MRRPCTVSIHERALVRDYQVVSCAPGAYATPAEATAAFTQALDIKAPATVAAALQGAKRLDLTMPPDLDGMDHWFRARLPGDLTQGTHLLVCDGLATVADVWVDGEHVLHSENMYRRYEVPLRGLRPNAELVLRFASLTKFLAQKRARPRWKTRIVDQQQLRWARTTLIGRTPGMGPKVPVVGPFRALAIETRRDFVVQSLALQPKLSGMSGELTLSLGLTALPGATPLRGARLRVEGEAGEGEFVLSATQRGEDSLFQGTFKLDRVRPWWPHTHGSQPLSRVTLELDSGARIDLGKVGFREVKLERGPRGEDFVLHVNGERLFCRGACWTTDDLLTLAAPSPVPTLELVRAAGLNMLRVGGTTVYESDAFYQACDELGILVWQDFMFANMDYPAHDEAFLGEVRAEVESVLSRISHRPCLTVLCGNSEIELSVAALGMPRELWQSPLFYEHIPKLAAELAPEVPYVSSSATGGALPFHTDHGPSHYYGVGAYMRPLDDARRAYVRFAAECLGFANVPRRETIERFLRDLEVPTHHPRWKERVPRDRGAGWDFDDVCDHYVRSLFGAEAAEARYVDPEHYLDLSRAAVCTAMEAAFSEWRSARSTTGGALVWFLKDFWPGAGWGVIDAYGLPKAAYHALARVCAPVALLCTDEGLNGVALHVINEREQSLEVELTVRLYRGGEVQVAEAKKPFALGPRSVECVPVDGMLERFLDSSYAYRFGPPQHDLLVATLKAGDDVLARAVHEPLGRARPRELDLGLAGYLTIRDDQPFAVVRTRRFAQRVSIEVDDHLPRDDFFHLSPGEERWVELSPAAPKKGGLRGRISALNSLAVGTLTFTDSIP
jgi:beta-mannosidase